MNMRIQQLPPAIANQIAAGEVIERPASVVKELLENSLDAGATSITVDIEYGGLNCIKICDNGTGIFEEDLPLAIAAHATSKISRLDDLYAINSMGFRGEALASIASVARVSISSKPKGQVHAAQLVAKNSTFTLSVCARSEGTTIEVYDLFYNAPVRKKFLKSERLEFQAIEAVVKRFALSAPHIAIQLTHNSKQVFTLPAALNESTRRQRMTKILGSTFVKEALFLDVEQGTMRLYGWTSSINNQRSQNDRQWVYINNRMIKDKLINHAIKQAYADVLYPGRFPSCLLYFTINSAEVDVNVHPTKHEVRFQQPRLIHDFFSSHLAKALYVSEGKIFEQAQEGGEASHSFTEPASALQKSITAKNAPFAKNTLGERSPNFLVNSWSCKEEGYKKGDLAKSLAVQKPANLEQIPWTVLNKQYCLFWIQKTPYLVDVFQTYKSWVLHRIQSESYPLTSRPLLVAVRFPMPSQEALYELQRALLSLGIVIEEDSNELVIRGVPILLPYLNLKLFFERLLFLEDYSMIRLQNELLSCLSFEAQQLSIEEREVLSEYVLMTQRDATTTSFFKPLTMDDCRMLLHV